MSRIGRAPITIPEGVKVDIAGAKVTVQGKLGTLSINAVPSISVKIEDGKILCTRRSEDKSERALHGLTRALIMNMVTGVTKGFEKAVVINGVGYKAAVSGKKLNLSVGYSHPVEIVAPEGISFVQVAPLEILIKGIDKALVGQVAAQIKAVRPIEPYHGYGIRYKDEAVVIKEGKKASK
jgi:large subunit ribosomal protein L6